MMIMVLVVVMVMTTTTTTASEPGFDPRTVRYNDDNEIPSRSNMKGLQ